MSKMEFLEELQHLLEELPVEERKEAIRYYESYFEEAGTEQEQIVLEELGSAKRIATQIIRDYKAEKVEGIYTEQGYREAEPVKQMPQKYDRNNTQEEQKTENSGSGIYVTNKGLSGGTLVLLVILGILTFPIWISILGAAFGVLMGLFGASIGIVVGFGVGGIGCIIGGIVAVAVGIFKSFTIPVVGAALLAIGLVVFGIGCLMLAAAGGVIPLAVWLVNAIIQLFHRLFHGRKGAKV